ncbi:MAG TPA: branched-chain amino acid ABC transporter permease [Candidatus Cybelea sp.]|nr:branched-chain amino acid ABC transporter permease [Candidatus Cybelea sp.]
MLADIAQLALNGLVAGVLLAVPAIGLTTVFAVLRFPNFAISAHATIGAFAGYLANVTFGLPAPLALVLAFMAAGAFGVASDELALKPMRPHGALPTAIASIALTLVLENVVRFAFGNEIRGYDLPVFRDWRFGALHLGPQQAENAALAVAAMIAVFAFLAFTRAGKAMRAVADNPTLADLKGIDPLKVARAANFTGMGLAGAGGMLLGLDTSIDPLTGFRALLPVFAAAVLGGLGSIPGAVLGALVVGLAEELSLIAIAPTYRTAIGFLAILLTLTIRPRGILGERAY